MADQTEYQGLTNWMEEQKMPEYQSDLEKYFASEEKYKFLFNNGNDAIFFHELGGRFVEVNAVACRNLGYTRDELLNMSTKDLDDPSSKDPQFVEAFMKNGYAVGEVVHRCKDGSLLPLELSTRLFKLNGRKMVLTIARDIRERKKAEENERQYKEHLEHLYRETKDNAMKMEALNKITRVINSSLDFNEVVNAFAEETYRLFEFDEINICLRKEDEACLLEKHRIIWGHNQPIEVEPTSIIRIQQEPYAVIFKTGKPLFKVHKTEMGEAKSIIMVPINLEGHVEGTFCLNSAKLDKYKESDVRFLLSLAEQLGIALKNARLHARVQKLAVVLERNRLAQEIHDSTLQILGYFRAKGEFLEKMMEKSSCNSCLHISKEIQKVAIEAYNDTREAIHALSEQIYEGQKFEDVFNNYLEKFRKRWSIEMEIEVLDPFPHFERDSDLQLLRVVQEALANVRKHAGAQRIQITAHNIENGYALDIQDDGIGFDPPTAMKKSFGLKIMSERMTSIGGYLKISSENGKGSCVRAWVPFQEEISDRTSRGRKV